MGKSFLSLCKITWKNWVGCLSTPSKKWKSSAPMYHMYHYVPQLVVFSNKKNL